MKSLNAFILAIILVFSVSASASAQGPESIWLTGGATEYKTGETVIITVNASTVVPVQGFTFQINYDPACLEPIGAKSPIKGMNGLSLPQVIGQVDASFASTTPQSANGTLAEVRFKALKGCQTALTLESAALAIRDARGMAAPVAGIAVGANAVELAIDSAVGSAQAGDENLDLALAPAGSPASAAMPRGLIVLIALPVVAGVAFGASWMLNKGKGTDARRAKSSPASSRPSRTAYLQYKHGIQAGKIVPIEGQACHIGSDPGNEICLDDPHIQRQHVKIYATDKGYFLTDLGGETYINGKVVKNKSAALKSGDVVRLGKRVLFLFGA